MQFSKFAIDDKAWCLWDWDLSRRNLNFLNSVDPTYFDYLARTHVNSVESDKEQHNAALALRMAYSHGLETFFAFLFAAIQAPDCVLGWVHKYDISQIKSLLQKMNDRQQILSKIEITPMTWKNIANSILLFSLDDKEKEKRINQGFAYAWKQFANDFLEPSLRRNTTA
jgi:hypothetical protein